MPSRTRAPPAADRPTHTIETHALALSVKQQGGSGMSFRKTTVDYDLYPPSPELSDEFPVILLRPQKPCPISPSQEENQISAAVVPVEKVEVVKKKKRRRTGLIGMPKKRVRESTTKIDPVVVQLQPGDQPDIKRRRARREAPSKTVEPEKVPAIQPVHAPPESDKLQELPVAVNPLSLHPNIRLLDLKMPRWFIPPMYQHLQ